MISSGIWAIFNAVRGVPWSALLPPRQPLGGREGEQSTKDVGCTSSLVCGSAQDWFDRSPPVHNSFVDRSNFPMDWALEAVWSEPSGLSESSHQESLGKPITEAKLGKRSKSEFCTLHMDAYEAKPALVLLRTPLLGPFPCCKV